MIYNLFLSFLSSEKNIKNKNIIDDRTVKTVVVKSNSVINIIKLNNKNKEKYVLSMLLFLTNLKFIEIPPRIL